MLCNLKLDTAAKIEPLILVVNRDAEITLKINPSLIGVWYEIILRYDWVLYSDYIYNSIVARISNRNIYNHENQ